MRYLIKRTGKVVDYMAIPKYAVLKKTSSSGYQIVKGKTKGTIFKGYTVVEAISHKHAINKILPKGTVVERLRQI